MKRPSKRVIGDWAAVILGVLFLAVIASLFVIGIWARIWAPCDAIDWMPTAEMPGRCLPGGRG